MARSELPAAGIAALLRNRLGECSPAERKVARALLAGYPAAGLGTVAELAQQSHVSAPTVLRLLARLNFSGFPEFQRALRDELSERDTSPLAAYDAKAPHDVLDRARMVLPAVVSGTLEALPQAELDRAVKLLTDRQYRITAYGGRFSRLLAHYLVLHLMQIRGDSRLLPDSPVERVDALVDIGRRDLFVLFDYRRYEEFTASLAAVAAKKGARIILCTDKWLSPVAGVADVVLPASVDSLSPYDSFVPTLAVLETLVAGVIERCGPAGAARLAEFEQASLDYRSL